MEFQNLLGMNILEKFNHRQSILKNASKLIVLFVVIGGMLQSCSDDSEGFEPQESAESEESVQEESNSAIQFEQVGFWGEVSDSSDSDGYGGDGYGGDGYGGDGYGGDDDTVDDGESSEEGITFKSPNGVAIDLNDNVYTTEFRNNRIQKFSSNGELLLQWGSTGTENGQFLNPTGIAIDSKGNVYVSESGNHRVHIIF